MHVGGFTAPGFEPVRAVFAEVVAERAGGAGLAVIQDGRCLIELWGGTSDEAGGRHWQRDTLVMPYSVTKAFVAVTALQLVDRGRLDLDAPAQRYWPQLRTPTTLRELLSHQSGLVALDEPVPTEAFYDWDLLCGLLAEQAPAWAPGTAHGESALFYGHLIGEIVRRVDGRRTGQLLREEICGPAALDFHIGLDDGQQARTADLVGFAEFEGDQRRVLGKPELYRRATGNPPGNLNPDVVNSRRWRAAEIPAINGHGTAAAVAGFYDLLHRGRLLSPDLLAEATRVQSAGVDRVFGSPNSWGLGFGLDPDGFGMGGLGGNWGGVSISGGYALSFLTSGLGDHDRVTRLENVVRERLGLSPVG